MQANQAQSKQTKKQEKTKQRGVKHIINLTISTWYKDSHGLYDYLCKNEDKKMETFKIENSTIIYRDGLGKKVSFLAPQSLLVSKGQQKQVRESYDPIAKLIFKEKKGKKLGVVKFEPIWTNLSKEKNQDSSKNFYKMINNNGLVLQPGYIIKMGRVEYMVMEIKNSWVYKYISRQKSKGSYDESNGIYRHVKNEYKIDEQGDEIRCRICSQGELSDEDPLISPCRCKSDLKWIHIGCLKKWIDNRVRKQIHDIVNSYNFTRFECQVCLSVLPRVVEYQQRSFEMLTVSKPDRPYLILESLIGGQVKQEQRLLHMICGRQIKIGRDQGCQIRLHVKIVFVNDGFIIKDQKSKFGTLVKMDDSYLFEYGKGLRVQYGRSLLEFELDVHQESDMEEDFEVGVGKKIEQDVGDQG